MKYSKNVKTLKEWLEINFGKTLCEIFFFPFHELYTANLYTKIVPQDVYKTPVNIELIKKGLEGETPPIGYNIEFVYPKDGLDDLIRRIANRCNIKFNKKVIHIDLRKKELLFKDEEILKYKKIFSTIPLKKMIEICEIYKNQNLPYTSVLVVNIGAIKGKKCPTFHWLYIPQSKSGFHRVGFYSNVENSFLPQGENERVSIYVEKAYKGSEKPSQKDLKKTINTIIKELKEWEFIDEIEVINPTWVDVAYSWEYPNNSLKEKAINLLRKNNIIQVGRYGRWRFQGIAESIKEGLSIKS